MSGKLKHDHRTVKRFVAESKQTPVRGDTGTMRKLLKGCYKAANRCLKLMVLLESCKH